MTLTCSVPCLFGLEGVAADELRRMNFDNVRAENGRVLFDGAEGDIARANINLATGERVLILLGQAPAATFDMLFEAARALPWERFIPKTGAFPVTGHALNSRLHSVPDCQKIVKKAVATRLTQAYGAEIHPESGAAFPIRFAIMNDAAAFYLDTSGSGLHKRGYRTSAVAAPLRETLAAALVRLSRYRGRDAFRDPFCGSGTIAIEAAFAAKNRAPGIGRRFAAETWDTLPQNIWKIARDEARSREYSGDYDIWGGDIDPACVSLSRENADRAGVAASIRFETADARRFDGAGARAGVIVTNPPYGERVMSPADAERLYGEFGAAIRSMDAWKKYILSSHTEFERAFGKTASKKRKLYNGMIKCDLFMYL